MKLLVPNQISLSVAMFFVAKEAFYIIFYYRDSLKSDRNPTRPPTLARSLGDPIENLDSGVGTAKGAG
jgi:hypothetical protein